MWVALGGHSSQKKIICSKKKVKELVKGKNEKKMYARQRSKKKGWRKEDKSNKEAVVNLRSRLRSDPRVVSLFLR